MPIFSVIIPTFNRVALLPRAVQSVLTQSFTDFELIVVNDAGTDETDVYVNSIEDERVVYIRKQVNGGHPAALNTGIRAARGQFVTLLDDDDEFLPGLLEKMNSAFEQADDTVGFGWCGIRIVKDTPDGEVLVKEKIWRADNLDPKIAIGIGSGCALTLRKSCITDMELFDESFRSMADTEFFFRLAQQVRFLVLPEVLVKIHEHSAEHISRAGNQKAIAIESILERNANYLAYNPDLGIYFTRKAAIICYANGERERARRHLLNALRINPFDAMTWRTMLVYEGLRRTSSNDEQQGD